MRRTSTTLASVLGFGCCLLAAPANSWAACGNTGVAVQILGSGGPFGQGRASAGYLVWIDGVSRIMIDAGGGTFSNFHKADARVADLDLMALSHFHPDHASEIPAILWTQRGEMRVAGPSGSDEFPSVEEFLDGLFGSAGVFRVIGQRMSFETRTVDVTASQPTDVLSDGRVRVQGLGVPHGTVPAVGYRVDVGDVSVAFSSDQNGSNAAFTEFIEGVDVLVVHFAASEDAPASPSALHAKPSVWGQIATDARVGTLVLSHLSETDASHPLAAGNHSGNDFESSLEHLRSRYDGPLVVAEDLMCVAVE